MASLPVPNIQTDVMPPRTPPPAHNPYSHSNSLSFTHKRTFSASPYPHSYARPGRSGPTPGSGSPVKRPRHLQHLRNSKSSSSILHSHTNPSQTRISKPVVTSSKEMSKCEGEDLLEKLEQLRICDEKEERLSWERSRGCGVGDFLYPYQVQEDMPPCLQQRQEEIQQLAHQRGRESQNQNQDPFTVEGDVNMDLPMGLNMGMNDFGRLSFFS